MQFLSTTTTVNNRGDIFGNPKIRKAAWIFFLHSPYSLHSERRKRLPHFQVRKLLAALVPLCLHLSSELLYMHTHTHPQTLVLWYKSLWWASIISSNNELSLALSDLSVWMCQRAGRLTERRTKAVLHFQDLPVNARGTWDSPMSVRDHFWRLTLDQRQEKKNSHVNVWPNPHVQGKKRNRGGRQCKLMRRWQLNAN